MKNPMLWLITVATVGLIIAGITFFATATNTVAITKGAEEARTPALVAGITCLVLATGLLVLGAFVFRKRD